MTTNIQRYQRFSAMGNAGTREDVDILMKTLLSQDDLATSKLVDFALGLVDTLEGKRRLREYLFEGEPVQRNYAALYFKRRGFEALLDEAVAQGRIDHAQAYAK